jgi:hypothetical protein
VTLAERAAHVRRLFPVVAGGKVAVLVIAEAFVVFMFLVIALTTGSPASGTIKACMIYPAMLLIVLCSADTVVSLRATGELELAVTLANPRRLLMHRALPIVVIAVIQVLVVGAVMMTFLAPWRVALGWLFTPVPLALACAATAYWTLRLRGTGAVLVAATLTLVPALVWVGRAEIFVESENMAGLTVGEVAASALRCQLALALATVCLAALAHRRLQRTEELLDE